MKIITRTTAIPISRTTLGGCPMSRNSIGYTASKINDVIGKQSTASLSSKKYSQWNLNVPCSI
jgi:hypothetical protein